MAREAHGTTAEARESLTEAWRRMDGQMMMIPAALCGSIEKLPGDMSYVLIRDPMWKIQRR